MKIEVAVTLVSFALSLMELGECTLAIFVAQLSRINTTTKKVTAAINNDISNSIRRYRSTILMKIVYVEFLKSFILHNFGVKMKLCLLKLFVVNNILI